MEFSFLNCGKWRKRVAKESIPRERTSGKARARHLAAVAKEACQGILSNRIGTRDERPRKMQKSCERRKDGGTSSLLVAPRAILERIMRTNANSRLVGHERATNVYLSRSGTDVHTYARHTLDNRGRCIRETRVPTHDTHVLLDDLALGFSPFDSLARPRPPPPTTPRCFPLFSPLLSTFSSACLSHEFPAT